MELYQLTGEKKKKKTDKDEDKKKKTKKTKQNRNILKKKWQNLLYTFNDLFIVKVIHWPSL